MFASAADYLPLAVAAMIGGIFAVIAALINRPKIKEAKAAADEAKGAAADAHTTATEAKTEAVTAKTLVESKSAVPSEAMVIALSEVIHILQVRLEASEDDNTKLRSELELLWSAISANAELLAMVQEKLKTWRAS